MTPVRTIAITFITLLVVTVAYAGDPPDTHFTYQGQLKLSDVPVNDAVDLSFQLFDEEAGGSQIGSAELVNNVDVVNGLFSVELDFGAEVFQRDELWLEVAARLPHDPDDTESFILLDPRQPIHATPFALQTRGLFVSEFLDVGIGVDNPSTKLHIRDPSNWQLRLQNDNTGGGFWNIGQSSEIFAGTEGGELAFVPDAADIENAAVVFTNDGRVGIGTTDPGRQLSVAEGIVVDHAGLQDGTTRDHALLFGSANSAEGIASKRTAGGNQFGLDFYTSSFSIDPRMSITQGGRVGIGTPTPPTHFAIQRPNAQAPVGITQNKLGGLYTMELTTADETGSQRTRILLRGNHDDGIEFYRGNQGEEIRSAMFDDQGKLRLFDDEESGIIAMGKLAIADGGSMILRDDNGATQVSLAADSDDGGSISADVKSFREPNPDEPGTDIVYACIEGPEAAAYVRGTADLVDGQATIRLPDHFRNVAAKAGMTVQLTPQSADSQGLAVVDKKLSGIAVREMRGGTGNYAFDYRVTAVRKGYEDYQVIRASRE